MRRRLRELVIIAAASLAGCSGSTIGGPGSDAGLQDQTTAACGAAGQACCNAAACNAGLACTAGACAPSCGGVGEPCCNGTACNATLTCNAGLCTGAIAEGGEAADSAGGGSADAADASAPDAPPSDGATSDAADASPSSCEGGLHTSISGRVYDPANVNPLYGVVVYVPGAPLGTLSGLTTCPACSSLYAAPVVSTLTDPAGNFHLLDVPAGTNVPLVVQIGKWRMKYTIGSVAACQDNPQPDHTLRLPQNHVEGDLPQIAIATGEGDTPECVPLRMGVDPGEYVGGAGTPSGGHIHIFTSTGGVGGAGTSGTASPDPAVALWDKLGDITPYDLVVLACEGSEPSGVTAATQQVLWNYTQSGGRVLATHYHYTWFTSGPFSTMVSPPLATWIAGSNLDNDPVGGTPVQTVTAGGPFPEGQGFAGWLADAGALQSGKVAIHNGRYNAMVDGGNALSQVWISADNTSLSPGNAQVFSFDTPPGASARCGRVVYSDVHATGGPANATDPATDYPGFNPGIVPGGCASRSLRPQEKIYEYMLLDLSSCLTPIGQTPSPPR